MTNLQLARLFRAVAAVLTLESGDNQKDRFRIVAYERAADAIEHASSEVRDLWVDSQLDNLPGIGKNMASYLDELFTTGKVRHFETILKKYPPSLFEIMEIPGIGPKTAYKLTKMLGINRAHSAITELEKAATKGHIRKIEGFGNDSESAILKGIQEFKGRTNRLLLPEAQKIADEIIIWLRKSPLVKAADPLGSLRRCAATIGDVDISASTDHPQEVIAHFCNYPRKRRVLEAGEHTASLILSNDYQVDLMVQPQDSYGSLLQHFTGSKHHNISLREYALKKGYSLSEYGIKSIHGSPVLTRHGSSDEFIFSDEKSFYNFLGLDYIPPELREDEGEIAAALRHQLPALIELNQIRGDLQLHSSINIEPSHDLGNSSVSEMAAMAAKLKYEYIGLTEHNPAVSGHTQTRIIDLVKAKTALISEFNDKSSVEKSPVYVFNGMEIDIQPSGARALPDSALELLDYACVSIHSSFSGSRDQMTKRVLTALDHPKVRFFAHPTGRLLGSRAGVELDWDKIFDFCLSHKKWLEIDGWPNRLDLPDTLVHEAVKSGVKIVIDTDSHAADQMQYMHFGVSVARRGWATAGDILNTMDLKSFRREVNI